MQKSISCNRIVLTMLLLCILVAVPACRPVPGDTPTPTPGRTATATVESTVTTAPTLTSTPEPGGTASPTPQGQLPAYPLKMPADPAARYLVDQNGSPFLIHGDTAWSLIGQLSYEDAVYYVDDTAARGFNSLIVTLTEEFYATNAPNNYYNTPPFLTPNKISTPNPAYFDHADRVIRYAASKGLNVFIAPLYLGCCDDGWYDAFMNNNTDADAIAYGEFIGRRYKDIPNIIYMWGNDRTPDSEPLANRLLAMVNAVKAQDPNHLHTYHWFVGNAYYYWSTQWDFTRDVNNVYAYGTIQDGISLEYNRTPIMPFFLLESGYENTNDLPPLQMRKQAYIAILGGAGGEFYGNSPIWHMGFLGGDWKAALDDEARSDMPHVRKLFDSRPWHTLVPDQAHTLVTDGYGSGADFAPAAATRENETLIVYLPTSRQVTIDLAKLKGENSNTWWYNPRTGEAQSAGTYANSGPRSFTPPDANDWVLVIDDAAAGFGAPGG